MGGGGGGDKYEGKKGGSAPSALPLNAPMLQTYRHVVSMGSIFCFGLLDVDTFCFNFNLDSSTMKDVKPNKCTNKARLEKHFWRFCVMKETKLVSNAMSSCQFANMISIIPQEVRDRWFSYFILCFVLYHCSFGHRGI